MITPHVGLRFYHDFTLLGATAEGTSPLCEVVEIRDGEIVRYQPVEKPPTWAGEIHVNFFHAIVKRTASEIPL